MIITVAMGKFRLLFHLWRNEAREPHEGTRKPGPLGFQTGTRRATDKRPARRL
jgi:hypothetical protein